MSARVLSLDVVALRGSPPHLEGLQKVGNGYSARWLLGTYSDHKRNWTISLGLDRHPGIRGAKLLFHDENDEGIRPAVERDERRSKAKKVGFILLECLPDGSALRGMRVSDDYRGQGHSLYLLAIWAVLCAQADCTPATRVINKPLLALALCRLGFRPRKGRGVAAQLTDARRYRDCDIAYARDAGATVRVHTEYVVTPECKDPHCGVLSKASDVLGGGDVRLWASAAELQRALTSSDDISE